MRCFAYSLTPIIMEFVVYEMLVGQIFPQNFLFSFIIIVCPLLYTCLSSRTDRTDTNITSIVKSKAVFTTHSFRFNFQ